MINLETKLKLQAYLDQELSDPDSREMAEWLERDPEARALCAELEGTKALLEAGEVELKLPESREFYWSKIERAIGREAAAPSVREPSAGRAWWVRFLAPVAGAAVVLATGLAIVKLATAPTAMSYLHEIETPLEDTSAISFHSQSPAMTVVWVQSQPN